MKIFSYSLNPYHKYHTAKVTSELQVTFRHFFSERNHDGASRTCLRKSAARSQLVNTLCIYQVC